MLLHFLIARKSDIFMNKNNVVNITKSFHFLLLFSYDSISSNNNKVDIFLALQHHSISTASLPSSCLTHLSKHYLFHCSFALGVILSILFTERVDLITASNSINIRRRYAQYAVEQREFKEHKKESSRKIITKMEEGERWRWQEGSIENHCHSSLPPVIICSFYNRFL